MKYLFFLIFFSGALSAQVIQFEERISTCLSREILWEQFEWAFQDSQYSTLWPSSSSSVFGGGLLNGSQVFVDYQFGPFRPRYSYRIERVIDQRQFYYRALEDHPFEGGAMIQLLDQELVWTGEYLTRPRDFLRRQAFSRFEKNFFEELNWNIKNLEKEHCL